MICRWLRSVLKGGVVVPPDSVSIRSDLLERIVQIASPHIKAANRYQERLVPLLAKACREIQKLCSSALSPVKLIPEQWYVDPFLSATFSNPERMIVAVSNERVQKWFREHSDLESGFAILFVRRESKLRYGIAEEGGRVRQDVPQHILILHDPEFSQLVESEEALKQVMSDSAIEQLAGYTARVINTLEDKKTELEDEINFQRVAIRMDSRLKEGTIQNKLEEKQAKMNCLQVKLTEVVNTLNPENRLAQLEFALKNVKNLLHFSRESLWVDTMGLLCPPFSSGAREIRFIGIETEGSDHPVHYAWFTVEIPREIVRPDDPDSKEEVLFNTLV